MSDIYKTYLDYCNYQINLKPENWDFKSNPNYTYMLEHNNYYHIGKLLYKTLIDKYSYIINNNNEYN